MNENNIMQPVTLFREQKLLKCENCGKELFKDPEMSIIVMVQDIETKEIKDVYTCCKGNCDKILQKTRVGQNEIDGWKDISDFLSPNLYLKQVMTMLNFITDGRKISDKAFDHYKDILIATAPYVMRQPSKKEVENYNMDLITSIF